MTQGTLNLDAPVPAGDERTHQLRIGDRTESVTLRYVDGVAQPSEPDNPSYMRGWNAAARAKR